MPRIPDSDPRVTGKREDHHDRPGHGPGNPQRQLGRTIHTALSAEQRDATSGLGLGLYISKQIIEAHHGTIRVASEEGKEPAFIIELPTFRKWTIRATLRGC